jgi:hypothetical protein
MIHGGSLLLPTATSTLAWHTALSLLPARSVFLSQAGKHPPCTIKSVTNNSLQYALSIGYDEEYIEESVNIKFLCSQIDKD